MFSRICMHVGSASYMTGLFQVPLDAARQLVPDEYFQVAEIFPNQAVFFVGTGEFKDCPLGPYREMYLGFYTENREDNPAPSVEDNFQEFTRNESKMYMWKNWVTTSAALDKMDRAGSTVFRRGDIERMETENNVGFEMKHPEEGVIRFTAPKSGGQSTTHFNMKRTHYGRLHGEPSRCLLDLNIDTMVTGLAEGQLELSGELADACTGLGSLDQPLVAIWIDEMKFDMHKATRLAFPRDESMG